ncbi:hypothetical protein, partial [Kordiimonas laminariae]|uniref:hypothetical protein n=1 Tax=Kordiimonas laminariae TaxID=2917717 RepID=UPI001FF14189
LEPATLGVTGRYSNQLSYTRALLAERVLEFPTPHVNAHFHISSTKMTFLYKSKKAPTKAGKTNSKKNNPDNPNFLNKSKSKMGRFKTG